VLVAHSLTLPPLRTLQRGGLPEDARGNTGTGNRVVSRDGAAASSRWPLWCYTPAGRRRERLISSWRARHELEEVEPTIGARAATPWEEVDGQCSQSSVRRGRIIAISSKCWKSGKDLATVAKRRRFTQARSRFGEFGSTPRPRRLLYVASVLRPFAPSVIASAAPMDRQGLECPPVLEGDLSRGYGCPRRRTADSP
jgi:hypothetical protein